MLYSIVKTLHILSSVLLVGTGFGTAFYLFFVNRTRSPPMIAALSRLVVCADWCFTVPTIILQPTSGLWLVYLAHWPLDSSWLVVSGGLYVFAGACWLPVMWLQIRMAAIARVAATTHSELPDSYWRYAKRWELLGYPAFAAMLAIYYFMIAKPELY